MGFWDVVAAQPTLFAILYLATLVALVLVGGGRAVEATKQTQAYADAEARVAEAKAREAGATGHSV